MMKVNYFEISRIPTVDAKKVLATIEDDEMHPGRKRRRLDNLNVEERILRRKLKNRVAAQTARDRKKAHMDDMELCLSRIEKENKFLKKNNEQLRSQVHHLTESNLLLRSKLGLTPPASPSQDHTCLTRPYKNEKDFIITPSVSDHDHIVIKKEELSPDHDMRDESQTELLLDVLGDEEPIRVQKTVPGKSTNGARHTMDVDSTTMPAENHNTSIKQEEFDVDEFLSCENDDIVCPSSPESAPSSPESSNGSLDLNDIVKMCTKTDGSLVGDTTTDGCGITEPFIDDEFLLSCHPGAVSCSLVDNNDPFSDLFPSLLSV